MDMSGMWAELCEEEPGAYIRCHFPGFQHQVQELFLADMAVFSHKTNNPLLYPLKISLEQDEEIDGVLLLLNTVGGDIEAGLGIAELVAGMLFSLIWLFLATKLTILSCIRSK